MKVFMAFIVSLIYHCISKVYLSLQKGTSGSYGKEGRSPRDPGCSTGCSDWITLWVILLEGMVNVFHMRVEGQHKYLVTRKINTGRVWLSVHN